MWLDCRVKTFKAVFMLVCMASKSNGEWSIVYVYKFGLPETNTMFFCFYYQIIFEGQL